MYHDWWPYKWTSCWACVVRNQNYITATFLESIVQYLSVFNVKYTPTVHGKCINFPLLKGCSWNNHPYPFQIKALSVFRKIGTITKENHCILIDISCVNIFKSNIYIYQLCIANAPILTAKGFFLKQSNFYNQKLIGHPQWELNPRPPGDFTRHYKLWEWHFQLHDFEYWFSWCRCFFGKYQHTEMLIAIQVFAVEIIFDRCVGINRVV